MNNQHRNVIMYDTYERAFFAKALEEGFAVIPSEIKRKEDLDADAIAHDDYRMFYKYNPFKSTALQMFLIYDKIILTDVSPLYDMDGLKRTGFIEVLKWDDMPDMDWTHAEREYAMYLKPFVTEYLVKRFAKTLTKTRKEELRQFNLTIRQLASTFYDMLFSPDIEVLNRQLCLRVESFIGAYALSFYETRKERWEKQGFSRQFVVEKLFPQWWMDQWVQPTETLMTLLDMSEKQDAALLQKAFQFGFIDSCGVVEGLNAAQGTVGSYGILRACYEEAIGSLPRVSSLAEVLRLKEKRSKDIRKMRCVLSEIEQALRQGEAAAVVTAMKYLRKAARDLSRGTTTGKVSRWATYLSLPVGIIEAYNGLPPVAGISIASAGVGSTLISDIAQSKNKWIQVIR
ncbi:MAG: hypothetical protein LLG04_19105 [Parachlamydia sp.]|nr:hypothetical protein [Parachlamydia sp.]